MTRPERYDELRRQGRLAVNCTDLDKPLKLIGCVSLKADSFYYCDRCHSNHRLTWEKLRAVREQWERDNGIVSEVVVLREIVREFSLLVMSESVTDELRALQRRARELFKESGAA